MKIHKKVMENAHKSNGSISKNRRNTYNSNGIHANLMESTDMTTDTTRDTNKHADGRDDRRQEGLDDEHKNRYDDTPGRRT